MAHLAQVSLQARTTAVQIIIFEKAGICAGDQNDDENIINIGIMPGPSFRQRVFRSCTQHFAKGNGVGNQKPRFCSQGAVINIVGEQIGPYLFLQSDFRREAFFPGISRAWDPYISRPKRVFEAFGLGRGHWCARNAFPEAVGSTEGSWCARDAFTEAVGCAEGS